MPNQSINRILVPIDGSESAFRAASFAIGMAAKYEATLYLVHVLELNPNFAAMGIYGLSLGDEISRMQADAKKQADSWFEKVTKEAENAGVKTKSEIVTEFPLTLTGEIVNYAEHNAVDLIVMGSRGRTGFKKMLLGSVASGVVTYASCPVLVVK
jgi:nucleotide-binding universal stress UspA family protein